MQYSILICFDSKARVFTIRYDKDRISQMLAASLAESFDQLILSITTQLEFSILDLDIMNSLSQAALLHASKNVVAASAGTLVDVLFEQAKVNPRSFVVTSWDGDLSYSELLQQATELAYHLIDCGVKVQDCIPFSFNKSKMAIVAMIGILLSGCVCVPVDINTPVERTRNLIDAVKAPLILTDPSNASRLEDLQKTVVSWPVHTTISAIAGVDLPRVLPSSLAYIFFTSGSTGHPKGVMQEHGALLTAVKQLSKAFNIDEKTRTFQFSSFAFDVCVGDIFATMIGGGCICIPSEEMRLDDPAGAIRHFKATHACLTTTVASQIDPDVVVNLQCLFVGGEPLTTSEYSRWASRVALYTVYGTTESLIWDSIDKITSPSQIRLLGTPMRATFWVVDPGNSERLRPIGAVGELLIESYSTSRGYLGDPMRTDQSFIAPPLWLRQQSRVHPPRIYKTGDLVCLREDGAVMYVGRKDFQMKLNGQRVELEDIQYHVERNLASPGRFKAITEVVSPKSSSQRILTAFVALDALESNIPNDWETKILEATKHIRHKLQKVLPPHMIPSMFVPIRQIPLTTTGKADRKELRALASLSTLEAMSVHGRNRSHLTCQAPKTAQERLLCGLWASVLEIDGASIQPTDHFLQLGGDSIKAMKLVGLARACCLIITVQEIFKQPYLSSMAAVMGSVSLETNNLYFPFSLLPPGVTRISAINSAIALCGIEAFEIEDMLPCTPLQEGFLALSEKFKSPKWS
jgi:amino acid adenylation domain-containing protein